MRVAVALIAVAPAGCAAMLGVRKPLTSAEIAAKREQCFRSYAGPSAPPNPRAAAAIRTWYAGLTPAVVATFDDGDSDFPDRAMAHAVAAGVPEAAFLSGEHPDPNPDCGLGWSHQDLGNHRQQNAASAVRSALWRSAFATCSAAFEAVWPAVKAANDAAAHSLAALPPSASADAAWAIYHRAMAAHRKAFPAQAGDRAPIFAHTGAPYLVWTDLMTRFPSSDTWFLATHWLGGVSPLADGTARFAQPLDESKDEARVSYCAQMMDRDGTIGLDPEQVTRLTHRFDGEAWLVGRPGETKTALSLSADDFQPGGMVDRGVGRTADDRDRFRLYSMPVTALKLTGGHGTIVLGHVERTRTPYNCKRVTKVTRETADTASVSHEQQCLFADLTTTDTLTLAVERLPDLLAGAELAVGDQLVFYAHRETSTETGGSKATRTGTAAVRDRKHAATLVFLAQVTRGKRVVYPSLD